MVSNATPRMRPSTVALTPSRGSPRQAMARRHLTRAHKPPRHMVSASQRSEATGRSPRSGQLAHDLLHSVEHEVRRMRAQSLRRCIAPGHSGARDTRGAGGFDVPELVAKCDRIRGGNAGAPQYTAEFGGL